jgi:hypothetical protein
MSNTKENIIYQHFLKGLIYLDIINLDEKMVPIYYKEDGKEIHKEKVGDLFNNQIFLDLSQCRFAEIAAMAKLLLIIESFLKKQDSIYIALPTIHLTDKEKLNTDYSEIDKDKIFLNSRKDANDFIKKSGFVSAVQTIAKYYEIQIYITEDYQFDKQGLNISSFLDSFSVIYEDIILNEKGYEFLLPFEWIDCRKGIEDIPSFENRINKILENKNRGIDSIDIKSIKNVILSELIKNVKEHSGSHFALFSIGLVTSNIFKRQHRFKKDNPIETEYKNWVIDNNFSSQVEIYFGDSGKGIINNDYKKYYQDKNKHFTNKEILLSTFQKWTTTKNNEPRRGTKGLYRLHRIIKKYNGLVYIDSLKNRGGFFKSEPIYKETEFSFQGTLINIKLNPFRELAAFKFTIEKNTLNEIWNSEKFLIKKDFNYNEILNYLKNKESSILILDITQLNLAEIDDKSKLEEIFYNISFDSEPLIIYLIDTKQRIDNDLIDDIADSVQNRIINSETLKVFIPETDKIEDKYGNIEISDPILVIGDNNKIFWYGENKELVEILNEAFLNDTKKNPKKLESLKSYLKLSDKEKISLKLYLNANNHLVTINNNHELLFNFYGIENHYLNKISKSFQFTGKDKICTPKLHIIEEWSDIPEILKDDEHGFALAIYLKYRNYIENKGFNINDTDRSKLFILIDHNQQYQLTKKFSELLGIRKKNIRNIDTDIDFNIPKRTKLFPEGSNVIILTTVISSSETVRRLVKYIKRDFAIPQVILCLSNFRKYNISHLETWSETTEILSCFRKYNTEEPKVVKNDEYFFKKNKALKEVNKKRSPAFAIENENNLIELIEIEPDLINFLKTNKLLHYNHYGVYNKRHFTFFLNKVGIVNIKSFIWENVKKTIDLWLDDKKIGNFHVILQKTIIGDEISFKQFLNETYKSKVTILHYSDNNSIINYSNVFYFDFGILTGESINRLINQCVGVDNLFVCLLFNQLINSNSDIFSKIDTLKYQDVLNLQFKPTQFRIEYLYHLPLSFFTSENCPICEHIRALDFFRIDQKYLSDFSKDRRERLIQNISDDLIDIKYPIDFYYSEESKNQELSIEIIIQMYEIKILLENAKRFTTHRIELYYLIFRLYNNLKEEIKNSESNVYSTLYYLSHEINWFQQEPLVFADFRFLISKIALEIAVIPLNELMDHFEISNKYDIPKRNLATRYKYAAISVLRSTDKLVFCQKIFEIIQSSVIDSVCSDNLLQNTLYHITSLHKNKYNKSEVYYIEIGNNLSKVINGLPLNKGQKDAVENILETNRIVKRSTVSIDREPKLFKEMADKMNRIFNIQMPRHPEPILFYLDLILIQRIKLFEEYETNLITDENKIEIDKSVSELKGSWQKLNNFIENNIIYYFNQNLDYLTESEYFKDEFSNFISLNKYSSESEKFNSLIDKIQNNPKEYLISYVNYEQILKYFRENFVQKNKVSGFESDSKILQLISDFPTNILTIINEVFNSTKFKNRDITLSIKYGKDYETIFSLNENSMQITEDTYNVYFPKSILKKYFILIQDNITQRLNSGSKLEDIQINFKIIFQERNLLGLEISYNLTDQFKNEEIKKNGALGSFKKKLNEFGGTLDYYLPSDHSNLFILKLNFLRYG